jgi:hypothetical protein
MLYKCLQCGMVSTGRHIKRRSVGNRARSYGGVVYLCRNASRCDERRSRGR